MLCCQHFSEWQQFLSLHLAVICSFLLPLLNWRVIACRDISWCGCRVGDIIVVMCERCNVNYHMLWTLRVRF
jgi:hypothetical protein